MTRPPPFRVACQLAAWGVVACFALHGTNAGARLVEEKWWVPVQVTDAGGKAISRRIMVTLFYDTDAPKPYPALVLNHGRSAYAAERAAIGRARFGAVSQWLTGLGFLVAVPTRIGYGVTGGEDVEFSGSCHRKVYPPAYAASAQQTVQVLDYVRKRRDVAKDRAIVMGQSFGGTTAITIAAMNVRGVQATVNFAGGGGGNPKERPQDPCGQPQLRKLFADYGKTARIPTLWIYSANDMYFGAKLPKIWFDAFRDSGGTGEYKLFPPYGQNGHALFTGAPRLWQPTVLEFLHANGYPTADRRAAR